MKKLSILLATIVFFTSCHKIIEKKAEDAILAAMTDGQWVITSFTTNGTDITSNFSSYRFQYFRDYTVNAINNGTVEKTGSWQADASAMNISANFSNASQALTLINGTWHITDNSWTYVVATMTVGTEVRTLRLEKQ
jgi:hypothetical protein